MPEKFSPSVPFADLFFFALDHGIRSIEDGGGPLISFAVVVDTKGHRNLHRFVTEQLEDGVKSARKYVADHEDELQMYAIAWDGFVTVEGKRTDAILVEAGDRGETKGVLFCQRYVPGNGSTKLERIGNPGLIGRPENLLPSKPSSNP